MRRLRRKDKDLRIWIDAIRIDQLAIEERNDQVARMRDIYRSAEEVVIWLGDDSKMAISALNMLLLIQLLDNPERILDGSLDLLRWFMHNIMSLVDLGVNPWWERVWVIQEVVFAVSSTIYYVEESIPWDLLSALAFRLSILSSDHFFWVTLQQKKFGRATDDYWNIAPIVVGSMGEKVNKMASIRAGSYKLHVLELI